MFYSFPDVFADMRSSLLPAVSVCLLVHQGCSAAATKTVIDHGSAVTTAAQDSGDGGAATTAQARENQRAAWRHFVEAARAAEHGSALDQITIGAAYENGLGGMPPDYVEAARWYRKAAERGEAYGQYSVGRMYDAGLGGLPQDHAEAVRWYRMAAEQGLALAQNNLGVMYGNGEGVPQDYVEAHKWFNLAVSRFPAEQIWNSAREDARKNRDAIAAKMTPEQLAQAQKLAHDWKPKKIGSER